MPQGNMVWDVSDTPNLSEHASANFQGGDFKNEVRNYSKWLNYREEIAQVEFEPSFAQARPKSCASWFERCINLTQITGLEYLNTSEVKSMLFMFRECAGLTGIDLSHFNTGNVTNMFGMFFLCENISSLDVSHLNTEKVTNMSSMFYGCSQLRTLDVSSFNTSAVIDFGGMFMGCSALQELDMSKFDMSNVQFISDMFAYCTGLRTLNLKNFILSSRQEELGNDKLVDVSRVFFGCSNLTTIYCNDSWPSNWMIATFDGCTRLQGAIAYDSSKTGAEYANPLTGYFTATGEGDVTGIKNVVSELATDTWYDLQGRNVQHPQKGKIYIRQGKKVLVK